MENPFRLICYFNIFIRFGVHVFCMNIKSHNFIFIVINYMFISDNYRYYFILY